MDISVSFVVTLLSCIFPICVLFVLPKCFEWRWINRISEKEIIFTFFRFSLEITFVFVVPLKAPLLQNILQRDVQELSESCTACPSLKGPFLSIASTVLVAVVISLFISFFQALYFFYCCIVVKNEKSERLKKYEGTVSCYVDKNGSWMVNSCKAETLLHGGFSVALALLASITDFDKSGSQSFECYQRELWLMVMIASISAVIGALASNFANSNSAIVDTVRSILSPCVGKTFLLCMVLKIIIVQLIGCLATNCHDKCALRTQIVSFYLISFTLFEFFRLCFCYVYINFVDNATGERRGLFLKSLHCGSFEVIMREAQQEAEFEIIIFFTLLNSAPAQVHPSQSPAPVQVQGHQGESVIQQALVQNQGDQGEPGTHPHVV